MSEVSNNRSIVNGLLVNRQSKNVDGQQENQLRVDGVVVNPWHDAPAQAVPPAAPPAAPADANAVDPAAAALVAPPADAGIPALPAGAAIDPAAGGAPAADPAAPAGGDPEARVQRQLARIQKGLANGNLTADQAQALTDTVNGIEGEIQADQAANGGTITADQLAGLTTELNASSGAIYQEKQTTRVNNMAAAGTMTQDQADAMTQQIATDAAGIADGSQQLADVFSALQAAIVATQAQPAVPAP